MAVNYQLNPPNGPSMFSESSREEAPEKEVPPFDEEFTLSAGSCCDDGREGPPASKA